MSTVFDIRGKVAIVTGGNGGISYGIACGLAAAGTSIVVAARQSEKTAKAVATLQKQGWKALGVSTDVHGTRHSNFSLHCL